MSLNEFLDSLDEDWDIQLPTELDLEEIISLAENINEISEREDVILIDNTSRIIGREAGDDRVDISQSTAKLCAGLCFQERLLHMATSPEDTGIRRFSWNFCEVSSVIPTDPYTSYDFARKVGDFSYLGYSDSTVLRLILDVQKGSDNDHSSTPAGKMSMLGSRLSTPRAELRGYWMIASLFQDAYLEVHKAQEPKYLPMQMGGTGVTPLFDEPENIYLYTLAYRGGKYARIYGTATHELSSCVASLERGHQQAPVLSSRLREKQEYFHGTYDNKVFVPVSPPLLKGREGVDGTPPVPLYLATGAVNRYQAFENRLVRTRRALTQRQASIEWLHTTRLQSIFDGVFTHIHQLEAFTKDQQLQVRSRFSNALTANTALQNLLSRTANQDDLKSMIGDKAFSMITTGRRTFERSDAEWIYRNGQGENYSLQDITLSEDIFARDEVSIEETFMVSGIPLRPLTHLGIISSDTKTKIGLFQINRSMEEWADNLLERLKAARTEAGRPLTSGEIGPIFDADPEWVNDDSGLIAQCLRDTRELSGRTQTVLLVSADKRLANQMAETANVTVLRMRPLDYILVRHNEGIENPKIQDLGLKFRPGGQNPRKMYVDTGSLSHYEAQMSLEEGGILYKRDLIQSGWNENLSRYSKIRLTPQTSKAKPILATHYPLLRPKVWRQRSRPGSSIYSSHDSWRRTDVSDSTRSVDLPFDNG